MYFDPVSHAGRDCRDGGLKENNPTQVALIEAREVWGDAKPCDIILSVGSGYAKTAPIAPKRPFGIPGWLYHLFNTLLDTMNGQEAWNRFYDTLSTRQKERAARLNVLFQQDMEPGFDDLAGIGKMEQEAQDFVFPAKYTDSTTSPVQGPVQTMMIDLMADRLRASLFFFDLDKVTQKREFHTSRARSIAASAHTRNRREIAARKRSRMNLSGLSRSSSPGPSSSVSMVVSTVTLRVKWKSLSLSARE